ncbi:DDE-type integrase/transposase/recombinase [Flavobacterium oreochromis]|uniref:DDE-type integrase/transposase/recombinase n=3 Tax=Flavobacterium oreochromis TaxID=2906078 RepID=A0ABW8PBF3_9FLAO|nr:DDE-type integrase/transposase/recombinase [Flavobacterium oreochromis]OWP74120.1 hypothetical protein BWG23_14940 [Flavobacterium oreochromis]
MKITTKRRKWHTYIKLLVKHEMTHLLPTEVRKEIPKSNIHNWKKTDADFIGVDFIEQLIKHHEMGNKLESHPKVEKVTKAMLLFADAYKELVSDIKAVRIKISQNKEKIVDLVEKFKNILPIKDSVRLLGISRATYQNYKTLVINKCYASYFEWCVKRYPLQLLSKEIVQIKKYFENPDYQFWSKSSLYYLGLRNKDFSFCLATFYKYSKLLGYTKGRHLKLKTDYTPLVSTKPNQIWCADVTIHKTKDGVKHYIHFLMDHYSKMILGWQVGSSSQPKIIKSLLQNALEKYPNTETTQLVTDAGIENVNTTVQNYIKSTGHKIIHKIAQKDIASSNSAIEAFNKVFKNQFIRPQDPENGTQLNKILEESILIYCKIRPQHSLRGNTPFETLTGKPLSISQYNSHFKEQKQLRKSQNNLNRCKKCTN